MSASLFSAEKSRIFIFIYKSNLQLPFKSIWVLRILLAPVIQDYYLKRKT